MPCQAPAAAITHLVCELKAQGEEESHNAFDKRFAVAKELKVRGFVVKIDGNGPVFAGLQAVLRMSHPQLRSSVQLMTQDRAIARGSRRASGLHHIIR
jgi:hypothetical protein